MGVLTAQNTGVRKVKGWPKDENWPVHSCGSAATKGCSWPSFWADWVSYSHFRQHLEALGRRRRRVSVEKNAAHRPGHVVEKSMEKRGLSLGGYMEAVWSAKDNIIPAHRAGRAVEKSMEQRGLSLVGCMEAVWRC
jgi:hypothetical protein